MGLLSRLGGYFEKRWHPLRDYITTSWLMSSGTADAGQVITPDVAMQASAVFACVNVIATTLATLPIRIVRTKDQSQVDDHPLCGLLNRQLNPEMTAASGRECLGANLLLWGNGFGFIETASASGRPVAIWPLRAQATTPTRAIGSTSLLYRTISGGASYEFPPEQIVHIPDLSYDGIVGLSRTRYGTNPIGLALAMERYGSKFFANGANAGGFVELPPGMKPDAIEAFKKSWREQYAGVDNAMKTGMLPDGIKYSRGGGMEPSKSQMIDTRIFQVREVARLYRVPLHKIGDTEQATFSNIEQLNIEFAQDTIRPWAAKIDQELSRKLLLESEKGELEIRHDLDELLRADTAGRYAAYNSALQSGWMTRNEVRKKEGLTPIVGGDVPLQPLNMGTATPAVGTTAAPPIPAKGKSKAKNKTTAPADDEGENE